jgi:hypothetical protein
VLNNLFCCKKCCKPSCGCEKPACEATGCGCGAGAPAPAAAPAPAPKMESAPLPSAPKAEIQRTDPSA